MKKGIVRVTSPFEPGFKSIYGRISTGDYTKTT